METIEKYEVSIFIGSRNEKTHGIFTKQQLISVIQRYQTASGNSSYLPVRITDITFVAGVDYYEHGFQITAARLPTRDETEKEVWAWTNKLAHHLLITFNQHRVGVSDEDHMIYLRASGKVKQCV
jgi:hypothetical protein